MSSIVWFEIPADDVERAKSFYGALFGWKIEKFPGPMEYWHIDTGGSDDAPDGGLLKRQQPQQGITNYIGVTSVDESAAKVEKLGGKICLSKTAVPRWATSSSARTQRTTRSLSGKRTTAQNRRPEFGSYWPAQRFDRVNQIESSADRGRFPGWRSTSFAARQEGSWRQPYTNHSAGKHRVKPR
jgi:predicted enzyme related to lactoylglutathione lyase